MASSCNGGNLVFDSFGPACDAVPTCPPGASIVQDGMFQRWRCAYPLDFDYYAPGNARTPNPLSPPVYEAPPPVYNQPGEKPDNEEIVRENIQCLWGETWWDANGNGHCQSLMCAENETHVWNPDGTEQCVSTISVSDVPDDFPIYADILPDGTMTISHTPQVDPWSVPCVAPNVRRTNGSCGPYIENIPPQAVQSVQLQPTASLPLPNTTTAAPSVTGIAAVDNFLGQFVDAKGQILGMSPVVAIAIAVGGVLLISSGGRK